MVGRILWSSSLFGNRRRLSASRGFECLGLRRFVFVSPCCIVEWRCLLRFVVCVPSIPLSIVGCVLLVEVSRCLGRFGVSVCSRFRFCSRVCIPLVGSSGPSSGSKGFRVVVAMLICFLSSSGLECVLSWCVGVCRRYLVIGTCRCFLGATICLHGFVGFVATTMSSRRCGNGIVPVLCCVVARGHLGVLHVWGVT